MSKRYSNSRHFLDIISTCRFESRQHATFELVHCDDHGINTNDFIGLKRVVYGVSTGIMGFAIGVLVVVLYHVDLPAGRCRTPKSPFSGSRISYTWALRGKRNTWTERVYRVVQVITCPLGSIAFVWSNTLPNIEVRQFDMSRMCREIDDVKSSQVVTS